VKVSTSGKTASRKQRDDAGWPGHGPGMTSLALRRCLRGGLGIGVASGGTSLFYLLDEVAQGGLNLDPFARIGRRRTAETPGDLEAPTDFKFAWV
jgi:hypothetical protein